MTLFSDFVFQRTYSQVKSNGRKETREDTVNRVKEMHLKKFPGLREGIEQAFTYVHHGLVVPSMRSFQFAGPAIERENARMFNCSFANLTDFTTFAELMYLLLCGTGTGFSIQSRHISQLPVISEGEEKPFLIFDNRESWCDSVKNLLSNPKVVFDYSLIREAGSPVSSGGTASGPLPLMKAHEKIRAILINAVGRQLRSIEAYDVMNHLADSVIVGGVRRSAMIALFDKDDVEMLTCKAGNWWEQNPQRGRANNSAVLHRKSKTIKKDIRNILKMCFASNAGEPGLFLTNCYDTGTNPCAEISLQSHQFCNLTEVLVHNCVDADDFCGAVKAAAFLGTLQSTYTNFGYLSPRWKEVTESENLLGVSITGMAMQWGLLTETNLRYAAEGAKYINSHLAESLGINKAARITTVKPSGSTSASNDCTSGIHAAHSPYYIRRVRIEKTSPLAKYMVEKIGLETSIIEEDKFNADQWVISVPFSMTGAIYRQEETAIQLLERMKHVSEHWITPGHRSGTNKHNISLTVSYTEKEVHKIANWLVKNRDCFTGISLLPADGGSYFQAPFETISEEVYNEKLADIDSYYLDFEEVNWTGVADERIGEVACGGGVCEIR